MAVSVNACLLKLIQNFQSESAKLSQLEEGHWNSLAACFAETQNSNANITTSQNTSTSCVKKSAAAAAPLQLPIRIYKTYKKKRIEAVLHYMDCERGWMRHVGDNLKQFTCIEIVPPPPPPFSDAASDAAGHGPHLYSTPTKAVKDWQKNTENGWAALKCAHDDTPLKLHSVALGGAGFKNPPFATTLHRDLLAMAAKDKRIHRFFHDKAVLDRLYMNTSPDAILDYLCQECPQIRMHSTTTQKIN